MQEPEDMIMKNIKKFYSKINDVKELKKGLDSIKRNEELEPSPLAIERLEMSEARQEIYSRLAELYKPGSENWNKKKEFDSINAEKARAIRNEKFPHLINLLKSAASVIRKNNKNLSDIRAAQLIAEKLLKGSDDKNPYIAEICRHLEKFSKRFSLNNKDRRREDEEEWKIEAAEYIRRRICNK
jgi:hypothetical protein